MTLRDIIHKIKTVSEGLPDVNSFYIGNIYEINEDQQVKYGSIVVTQDTHSASTEEQQITYSLYIFYVDRQTNDGSNVIEVQSAGITRLNTIAHRLADEGLIIGDYEIEVFREKFGSLCAGAYMLIPITTPLDICDIYTE